MTEMVMVKPLRTFDMFDGGGLRTPDDAPFEVPRGTAAELLANGLVEEVEAGGPAPTPKRKGKADGDE